MSKLPVSGQTILSTTTTHVSCPYRLRSRRRASVTSLRLAEHFLILLARAIGDGSQVHSGLRPAQARRPSESSRRASNRRIEVTRRLTARQRPRELRRATRPCSSARERKRQGGKGVVARTSHIPSFARPAHTARPWRGVSIRLRLCRRGTASPSPFGRQVSRGRRGFFDVGRVVSLAISGWRRDPRERFRDHAFQSADQA